MVNRVFHDGLEDDARHHHAFNLPFHTLEILDFVGKADVDDVQIGLHLTDFFREAACLPGVLDAVAEEVCKVLNKECGLLRAFHHRELRARVECIVEKMRVDLALQEDQLAFFEAVFHSKLGFLEAAFLRHAGFDLVDVLLQAVRHLVERVCQNADFVPRFDRDKVDVKIASANLLHLPGKLCQRFCNRA
ncbi:hypothetical protein SDC9_111002 [bioreactor metagenome]|uniref:Uncharacterized protein n=1 Tax=bioreactor metagenome TaxID=1076179 RepID=A0A645BG50_9ZZZZ